MNENQAPATASHPEPPRPHGPFETAEEARELGAVRAIYDAALASERRGVIAEGSHRLLDDACTAAGVHLGAFDHRTLIWLSGFEPHACAVIAGLITRAAEGAPLAATLTDAQRETLGHALGDAASAHDEIYCAACDALPGDELCPPCATGSAISGAYLDLGRELGLDDALVIGTANYRPYENRSEK